MQFSLRSNIINLYVVKVSKWFMLIMPIVVLFYNAHGLSMHEVFILQAIYSVSIVAWEIPSGYVADVIGRRKSMIIGAVLGFLGYFVYSFSYGFLGFMVAEIVLGIGQSMISGADSALLYDSLIHAEREEEYNRYEGLTISIGNFAEAFGGIAGGLLAVLSVRYPYYAQAFVAFWAIPASILLVEPPLKTDKRKPNWTDIFVIVKETLHSNPKQKWNTLFSSFTGASTLTMAWIAQPYFKGANLSVEWYGIVWTILNLVVGISSAYAFRVEKRFGPIATVTGFTVLLSLSYIFLGMKVWLPGLAFLLLFYVARGIATPTLKDYVNRITEPSVRATVLSIRNFTIRIIFAVMGPIYGWCIDLYGLQSALFLAGALYSIFNFTTLFYFIKYRTFE